MAYKAVIEARRAAEAKQGTVREAVRLGLQMKREEEARKQMTPLERAYRAAEKVRMEDELRECRVRRAQIAGELSALTDERNRLVRREELLRRALTEPFVPPSGDDEDFLK